MEKQFDQAELDKMAHDARIEEAKKYLKQTDWVEAHIIRHQCNIELLPETSNKWKIKLKRDEFKSFLSSI